MDLPAQVLDTARLRLRPVAAADEGAVVAALNDLDVAGWLAVVPFPYRATDFRQFQTGYAVPGQTYAVEDAGGLVGILGVEDRTLGYWLAPAAQGKGYATEAARAALSSHFAADPSDIASGYFEGNARSARVLEKLGFVEVGRHPKFCRALGRERPHVEMRLSLAQFAAAWPVEARSARLSYRPLQPHDVHGLHRLVSQWEVVRQLGPSWPHPAEMAFTLTRARPFAGAGFHWGIFRDGAFIGTVGVTEGELGYMIDPALHRQGFAREACGAALDRAFADGLDQVSAGVWADNAASLALLDGLGFLRVGESLGPSRSRGGEHPGHDLVLKRTAWEARQG